MLVSRQQLNISGGGGGGERAQLESKLAQGPGAHLRALEALGFHNVLCCNLLHVLKHNFMNCRNLC